MVLRIANRFVTFFFFVLQIELILSTQARIVILQFHKAPKKINIYTFMKFHVKNVFSHQMCFFVCVAHKMCPLCAYKNRP